MTEFDSQLQASAFYTESNEMRETPADPLHRGRVSPESLSRAHGAHMMIEEEASETLTAHPLQYAHNLPRKSPPHPPER